MPVMPDTAVLPAGAYDQAHETQHTIWLDQGVAR
jgi:hypothetical protein